MLNHVKSDEAGRGPAGVGRGTGEVGTMRCYYSSHRAGTLAYRDDLNDTPLSTVLKQILNPPLYPLI